MKLYFASGACSLSPHIVAREAGIPLTLERVDIRRTPHRTSSGVDFSRVSPNGYVPALELEDGSLLTEGTAILQFLADRNPAAGLMPAHGTIDRYRAQSWLNFVATELHKMYSPWLFHPEYGEQAQDVARARIATRLRTVEAHLATSGPYMTGDRFGAVDAYLFTVVGWSGYAKVDLADLPCLRGFMQRVEARPAVREALEAERDAAAEIAA
jgi:glutathione S-transferase